MLKMERLLIVSSKFEHHAVIRYYITLNYSASNIYTNLTKVYGNAVLYTILKRWCWLFLNGRMELNDEVHTGRLSIITEDTMNTVRAVVEQDRRVTIA